MMRSRLAWKLSAGVMAILAGAILLSGYVHDRIFRHYALESARTSLRFNSESLVKGIGQQMMAGNNEGVRDLIAEISRQSEEYKEIRLISHHSGEVVGSRPGAVGEKLALSDRLCAACHADGEASPAQTRAVDELIELPGGERALSVIAPIANEARCAQCHVHRNDPPILGLLQADYSLQRVDAAIARSRKVILMAVLAALLLGVLALWLTFSRQLARPIAGLIAGTRRIAANDLDFRFEPKRRDEIGLLKQSFNTMTARIRAHRDELRGAMEYLGGIVENSAAIIITVTPDGFIEMFNRGAELALGYDRIEVIGRPIEMLFADPRERDVAIARLADTDNVRNYETHFLTKGGQVRNVLLTLSRLRDREGNPIGTFGISKDITEEKRLQRELVQSHRFAAIGQAVTGIQHAIKNMLNTLKGGAYLVRVGIARDNPGRIEDGCAMVEEGIELISSLAHHLLDWAKEWKLELERSDLNELVGRLCEQNAQAADEQGVALCHQPGEALPAVLCDPKLIRLAATDIVLNAIDACTWKDYPEGESPRVVLSNSLARGGRFFQIEVRDNGCGMNEEIRRNIFTPFFSTKKTLGTGLGLALTARIIRAHGGEIHVESEPDHGAVFRIHLPIDGPRDNRETDDGQAGSRG